MRDGFYQFRWTAMAQYFALDHVCVARDFCISEVLDADRDYVTVDPHEPVFSCVASLPMGCSFGVHFCHSAMV